MIIHVDMDAFFASVEQLDNPGLAGKPVIVGGTSNRGVVAASSYEAREFGIYSAMPIFQARQKCPRGIFISPRRDRYQEISRQVMSILSSFTPLVEQVSIDEAFMDVTGCESMFGPAPEIGSQIKARIKDRLDLHCSVGIAPLKFLAKIASDMDKPDGLTFIPPEQVEEFIDNLPVRKVSGVGQKAAAHLLETGIVNLGDVKKFSREKLVKRLGKYGHRLFELAHGIDRSRVCRQRPVKSVSTEETLAVDINDKSRLKKYLLKHAEEVGRQLRQKGRKAGTVTLKIKHSDFRQKTRQARLPRLTCSSEKIYQAAVALLENYHLKSPVRLVGVGVSDLDDPFRPSQMELFSEGEDGFEKWEKVGLVVDGITARFGPDMIKKAGLAGDD